MSVNIQTSEGLKKLADKTTKKTIKKALGYIPSYTPNINDYDSDTFYIADSKGNVIFKVDKDGLHSTNLNINNKTLNQIIKESSPTGDYNDLLNKPNIVEDESSVLQITDNYGNVIATIDANGINTVGFKVNGKEVALKLDLDNLQGTIGSANGIAPLDATGKVSIDYIPDSVLGQLEYKGVWDPRGYGSPATNPAKGHYYIANTTGSYSPDGTSYPSGYNTGDWAVYNGTGWDKVDNTDAVTSVAGLVGPISVVSLVGALKGTTVNSLAVGNHTHTEYQPKLKAGTGISIASDGTISVSLASAESGSY